MQVGISAWRWTRQRLGIGRYIEYLLKEWSTMALPDDRFTVYAREPFDARSLGLSDAFGARILRPKMTNALWENLLLPRSAKGVDVLFGPSYTLPLTYRGRSVVAIHSVDEAQSGVHSLWHTLTYTQKYRLSALRADKVVVNAQSTKDRVAERYGVAEEKIEVIWLGVEKDFRPIHDDDLLRATRLRYVGADRPFILLVAGLSKRRNVPTLLKAFSVLKKRAKIPHSLLLIGPNRANLPLEQLASDLQISDSLVHIDPTFADHRELVPIYNAADLFVLPSSSDGFSLTLAEAMSCGTPVVTVSRAALGEVAHGYAMTIDEPDVDALADAMEQVLTDPDTSQMVRTRCLERARLFSWERTARRTLDVLRQVAVQ